MSVFKRNFAANLAGSAVSALLTIAVLPVYLRLLGPELYGLIGFYTTLQMLFVILDLGLGTAVNREMARTTLDEEGAATARGLLKTLEAIYWSGALLIFVLVLCAANILATHWLKPGHVSADVVSHAIVAMGVVLALQFPYGLYSGAWLGLQRHVALNVWTTIGAALRLLLPIAALRSYGPDIALFFGIQAVAMAVQTLGARVLVLRIIPKTRQRPTVNFAWLQRLRGFAAGVTAATALGVIVMQLDKVLLSRFAPLQELGFYSVAAAAATGLGVISVPMSMATFPRFSQLAAQERRQEIDVLYHRATQLLAALLLPLAAIIGAFSHELLLIWTANPTVAERGARPLSLLVIAISASSLGFVAQALQFAEGWTRFAVTLNAIGVLFLIPAMSIAAIRQGGVGVALMSAIWNVIALCITATVMHRRLVRAGGWSWFLRDVAPPLVASLVIVLAVRYVCAGLHGFAAIAGIVIGGLLALLASLSVVPVTWEWLRHVRSRSV
jgi:O-antigen/teichoic acid export membrane protein